MKSVKEQTERVLSVLNGLPLRYLGRAADLAWLGFGELIKVPSERSDQGTREVARHALHLQCPFRLVGPQGPVLGSQDMYYPGDNPNDARDDFHWDHQGANYFDVQAAAFNQRHAESPLAVVGATSDQFGGFSLDFTEQFRLEVFPATSFPIEQWRYFDAADPQSDFVVFE